MEESTKFIKKIQTEKIQKYYYYDKKKQKPLPLFLRIIILIVIDRLYIRIKNIKNKYIISKDDKNTKILEYAENFTEIIKMPNGYENFTVDKSYSLYYKIPKIKKEIKIKFLNFWSEFNNTDNFLVDLLSKRYKVTISDNPDYIIYSVFPSSFKGYKDKVKILYCFEKNNINFKESDYGLTLNALTYGDRHLRYNYLMLLNRGISERLYNPGKKFCCFVVSNCNSKFRNDFYDELSKYKKIDSGGKCKNNIGYNVSNKIEFFNNYKFSIVMENYKKIGYCTEKLYDAFIGNTIPIYYGDNSIIGFINSKSYIHIRNEEEIPEKIELIKKIDQDEELYKKYLKEPVFLDKNFPKKQMIKHASFIFNIFDQNYKDAKRRTLNPLTWFIN